MRDAGTPIRSTTYEGFDSHPDGGPKVGGYQIPQNGDEQDSEGAEA